MDGTVRNNIKIGATVLVVPKQDQRTGKLTEGTVTKILTNSQKHPRGIKVMLEGGIVGRVQSILQCRFDGKERTELNVQIFGTTKCFDTKKAQRYFKERGVRFQFIDLKEKGLSKGEYASIKQSVGGLERMINQNCKDKDTLALIQYIAEEDRDEKVLENQQILLTPLVRNGKRATVGYQPEVWKTWE